MTLPVARTGALWHPRDDDAPGFLTPLSGQSAAEAQDSVGAQVPFSRLGDRPYAKCRVIIR